MSRTARTKPTPNNRVNTDAKNAKRLGCLFAALIGVGYANRYVALEAE